MDYVHLIRKRQTSEVRLQPERSCERVCVPGMKGMEQEAATSLKCTPCFLHWLIHHLFQEPGKIQNAFKQHKHFEAKKADLGKYVKCFHDFLELVFILKSKENAQN